MHEYAHGLNYDSALHTSISTEVIEDLIQRLKQTRLPEAETVEDWSQGVPLSYQAELHLLDP